MYNSCVSQKQDETDFSWQVGGCAMYVGIENYNNMFSYDYKGLKRFMQPAILDLSQISNQVTLTTSTTRSSQHYATLLCSIICDHKMLSLLFRNVQQFWDYKFQKFRVFYCYLIRPFILIGLGLLLTFAHATVTRKLRINCV